MTSVVKEKKMVGRSGKRWKETISPRSFLLLPSIIWKSNAPFWKGRGFGPGWRRMEKGGRHPRRKQKEGEGQIDTCTREWRPERLDVARASTWKRSRVNNADAREDPV